MIQRKMYDSTQDIRIDIIPIKVHIIAIMCGELTQKYFVAMASLKQIATVNMLKVLRAILEYSEIGF